MTHGGDKEGKGVADSPPSTLFLELVDSETPLKQNLAAP